MTPAEARRLVRAAFPELDPREARVLGVGWDNTNVLVDGRLVFRFPRREVAVELLRREVRILPFLAPRLPAPIPHPTHLALDGAPGHPWPFAGYPLLAGRDAAGLGLDDGARLGLAPALGRFVAALHAQPVAELARRGLGPDPIRRMDLDERWPLALGRLDELREAGLALDRRRAEAIREAVPPGFAARTDVPVHGDLHAAQVLVEEDGSLSGVVDWGDAHLGDPACDLALAHAFLPPAARERFRRELGDVPEATWEAARLHALHHTLAAASFALATEDAPRQAEARASLRHLGLLG